MTMSQWNDKKNGGQMELSTDHVKEGSKALRTTVLQNDYAVKILTVTETDNPKEVTIEFWNYMGNQGNHYRNAHFFRYQDLNNYYSIESWQRLSNSCRATLFLREGAVLTQQDYGDVGGANQTWEKWKYIICEISNIIYVEIYLEVLGSFVLKDTLTTSPAKFVGGGAYGVGFEVDADAGGGTEKVYLDTTKVYY